MAHKIYYTHFYDFIYNLFSWLFGLITLFLSIFIAYIFFEFSNRFLGDAVSFILAGVIFFLVLTRVLKFIFYFDYWPTKMYLSEEFGITADSKECKYFSRLFSSWGPNGKWYPLKELKNVPVDRRKEVLFILAKEKLGYSYSPSMFEKQPSKFFSIKTIKFPKINLMGANKNNLNADALIKYENLLKDGAITQEEYNKIKNKILEKYN